MKKIVTGNHGADLFQVMEELGLTTFLGLPPKINAEELHCVYKRSKGLDPHHMTLIAAALNDENQVIKFNDRMKMSKDEFRTGVFITQHREDNPSEDELLRYCQDLMCDTVGKEPRTKDKVMELLKYWGKGDTLEAFKAWDLPKFPVNGISLLEKGVKKGPALAKMINVLRGKWKESAYTATEQELLTFVDELKETIQ